MSSNNIIDDDAFLFAGQNEVLTEEESSEELDVWRILIVDDEPEIHKVTQLALSDLTILGKNLEFENAYSREETIDFLKGDSDIAVILLDVVMETDDAELHVADYIRKSLKNNRSRIILRTGQPCQPTERQVILNYDINDYKSKTELTAQKLITVFMAR